MEIDIASDNTSLDDKTEDYCENPTRDALTEGILTLLKPTVDQLDERIRTTRISQIELRQQIDSLTEELLKINEFLKFPLELDVYVTKLINAKQKVVVINNILQKTEERITKIYQAVEKEKNKQKVLLDHI
ncbi:PREDICTED: SNAPIN protein homolog [Ceratosolen solmsi marchali]|uniref:Biogenesis of lysosome-related organelles complex 1 subunit 7 n=1 Tax=Ceratosolen solmsi marchali TaxID=326594 RepID=A0AAJ6YDD0_9HYME|nr:PREDICTED: SNAPIN protein homolog [Ceratosolen solmsi marchali]